MIAAKSFLRLGLVSLPLLFTSDAAIARRTRPVVQPDPLAAISPPSIKVSTGVQSTLLGMIPGSMRPPIDRLLARGFRPCDSNEKLPENCFATVAEVLGNNNFDPLAGDRQIEAMLGQAGYHFRQEFSPFKTITYQGELYIRGFKPDLLTQLDNLTSSDILLFGNSIGGSKHYLHAAIYIGIVDDKDYMFQARNMNCGPRSHYEIASLEDYLLFIGTGIPVTPIIPQTVFIFRH